jgi:hypothetical protein
MGGSRRTVVRTVLVIMMSVASVLLVDAGRVPARAAVTARFGDYQFSTGFSDVQGRDQWYYLQWDGSRYSQTTWDAGNDR